jgi:cell division protein FtsX
VIFLLRETWRVMSHIRGKLLLVIVLLTLSGVLAGLLQILYYNSSVIHHSFQRHLQGELFLSDNCSETELISIRHQLERDTLLEIDYFRSSNEARELFAKEFGDEIFEVLEENPLPASFLFHFLVNMQDKQLLQQLTDEYESMAGVLSLRVPSRTLVLLHQRITTILQLIAAVLLFLLVGAMLLVMYSTRQAVSHYWPEIDTMQLMGAGRWQIRLPFLSGTLLYSLLAFACGHLIILLLVKIAGGFGYNLHSSGAIWVELALLLVIGFGGTLPALNKGLRRK